MNIDITLQEKQKTALEKAKKKRVLFYGGAKGGGKSYLIRAREIGRRLMHPNTKGLIVRKTYPELLSNHIHMFFQEYPFLRGWYNKSEKTIYYPNGSSTAFSYLKNTDDVYTYQGREYDDISIDEITQHEEQVFKILRSSNRTTHECGKYCKEKHFMPTVLLTGNPGGIGHGWVKRIFVDRQFKDNETPDDFAFVPAKVQDNKALVKVDPDYVRRLDDLPDHLRRAYKEGDWDIFAGQVFDFRPTKNQEEYHVIRPKAYPHYAKRFMSIDWGGDKPVSINWYIYFTVTMPEGRQFERVWKYRELYYGVQGELASAEDFKQRTGMDFTDKNVAQVIADKTGDEIIEHVVGDPSMGSRKPRSVGLLGKSVMESMNDYWSDNNYNITIRKGDNDRYNGLNRLRYWLSEAPDGKPYYQIYDTCAHTIRTYPLLIYAEGKEDVDTDIEDHIYDADRYFFMDRPYGANEPKREKPEKTPGTFEWHLRQQRMKRVQKKLAAL